MHHVIDSTEAIWASVTRRHLANLWGTTAGRVFLLFLGVHDDCRESVSYSWPEEDVEILEAISDRRATHHCFYCPNVLSGERRSKGTAVRRGWLHLDLDEPIQDGSFLEKFPPTISVSSGSDGHSHLFWRLGNKADLTVDEHQQMCRAIGAALGCGNDKTTDNDLFRVPGTLNHKYDPPRLVTVEHSTRVRHDLDALRSTLAPVIRPVVHPFRVELPDALKPAKRASGHLQHLLENDTTGEGEGRGNATYSTVSACYEDGYTLAETLWLMRHFAPGLDKYEGQNMYAGGLPVQIAKCYDKRAQKTDDSGEDFWSRRDVLTHIRDFARGRMVSPWAVLGSVLARTSVAIPPCYVLPPTIGGHASLNTTVALVGKSGTGKGAAEKAAGACIDFGIDIHTAPIGSGEGIVKQYATRSAKGGPIEPLRSAVLFTADEVESIRALKDRGGATLMAELRKAWSGEALGFSNSDASKTIRLCGHRYRFALVVGVQPENADALLDDQAGGTPQRFLWFPTTDLGAPDEAPQSPEPIVWERTAPRTEATRNDLILDLPIDESDLVELEVPTEALVLIRAAQLAKLREKDRVELDSHFLLARLKVAALLMWLDRRRNVVTVEDWELAGVVIDMSNETRAKMEKTLREKQAAEGVSRARTQGQRAAIAAEATDRTSIDTLKAAIVRQLQSGRLSQNALKKKLNRRAVNEYFDDAVHELVDAEVVLAQPTKNGGTLYSLL